MKIKICKYCGSEFDLDSPEKVKAGGYINECVDCLEERGGDKSVAYLAVTSGNGKMSDITILKFENQANRENFKKSWRNNSGMNKGKSCQLGAHLTAMSGIKFEMIAENRANDNHKGKS